MSKARYAHLPAKIDSGLNSKHWTPRSPRCRSPSQECRSPRLTKIGCPSQGSARDTQQSHRMSFGRASSSDRSTTVSNVREDKETRREVKAAVQREMRSTTQVLRQTSADMKRLQTRRSQLDCQLQRTTREQERSLLKREDFLRTLQAKERSIDQSLLLRAKEEGELLDRLTYLKRQLEEGYSKLPTGGPKNDEAVRSLRVENKRLREQMRSLMENSATLNNRTPLQTMRMASTESQEISILSMNTDASIFGRLSRPHSAHQDQWSQRTGLCPKPNPTVRVTNRHVSRSLSPDAFGRKQLDPPNNLVVRFVSGGRISAPTMPPLPTVHLETPRDTLNPPDLRAVVGRKNTVPPPMIPITQLKPGRLDQRVIRGISSVGCLRDVRSKNAAEDKTE